MKRILLLLVGLVSVMPPAAMADALYRVQPTYVAMARLTAPGEGKAIYAFQNTDANLDVLVHKIEVVNATTMTVTGGTMQFWVYASTSLTHSAAITGGAYGYAAALTTQPSYISISSAPTSILHEGDTVIQSQTSLLLGTTPPLLRPFYLNDDEAATTLLYDSWSDESQGTATAGPLVLNHGANRALTIEQRRLGTTDFTAGSVLVRIFYTIR